uniref:RNA-directed RNA polymerase n=1 Tax=Citrus-associated rhabdovirus TaxID=2754374 RepID=A0A7D7QY67_9RHAB|nr:large RNA-dependent RNA polymerase [Citrus-associated rhabdovirus]
MSFFFEEGLVDEDGAQVFMKGLGDFHLRSAITLPKLAQLEKGEGRKREVKSIAKVKEKQLLAADPGRFLSLFFQLSLQSFGDDVQVPYLNELVELLEVEHSAIRPLTQDQDMWDQCLNILKTGEIKTNYGAGKLMFQLLVVYSMILSSGRTWEQGGKVFQNERDGTPWISIFGVKVWMLGEFIAIPYSESLRFGVEDPQDVNDCAQALRSNRRTLPKQDKLLILTLDMVRMAADKFSERENIEVANHLGSSVCPIEYPPPDILGQLLEIMDKELWAFGNHFYKFVKTYEAIVTGVILDKKRSPFSGKISFLNSTLEGLEPEFQEIAQKLVNLLWDNSLTIHHLTQFFGLFRIWGHPVVDTKKGIDKVFQIGGVRKRIDDETAISAGRKFKEIFFTNYRNKEGVYPNCETTEDNYVCNSIRDNSVINLKDISYNILMWDSVEIKKTFEIPKTFNLTMIIADKAVSADRDEIDELKGDATKILDPFKRRGVLKWIKQGMVNCKALLHYVNYSRCGLPKKCRIIGLYPKEREINPVARMFSLMSLMMRAYIVVTESMLADDILRYIPGVTMTFDLLELTKSMVQATRDMFYQGEHSRTFSINIDFEKWNLNFRKEATYHVFRNLGELYGLTQLYNRTYDIFRNSVLYLSDGSYLPVFDEQLNLVDDGKGLAKTGHLAGLEGLRQKGWTVFTAVVIAQVCDKLGIDYKLMGQGDNQVLVVKIYSSRARFLGIEHPRSIQEIEEKMEQLVKDLSTEFLKLGLPIKPLETWVSDQFFSYGKVPIFKGLPCAMSLKKIARVFAFSNEDLMTTDNALGAIIANSQAAAMSSLSYIVPYIMLKLQSLMCIGLFQSYHPLVGDAPTDFSKPGHFKTRRTAEVHSRSYVNDSLTDPSLFRKLAVSVPKIFGGFNSANAFHMIMRGFPDRASMDASWIYAMVQQADTLFTRSLMNMLRVVFDNVKDYSYLIQDPESINIVMPPSTKTIIKNMVRDQLREIKGSTEASELFFNVLDHTSRSHVEDLCVRLTSNDSLNVRFLHDIMGSTLFGYCDSVSSKIDKTVTLSRMTSFSHNVVGVLAKGEKNVWDYFKWRILHSKGRKVKEACPTEFVRNIRDEGWKKHIIGVTTPFPFHFLTTDSSLAIKERMGSYLYAVISEYTLRDPGYLFLTLGKSLPYLGSVIKEKLQRSEVSLAFGSEPLISRPVRMLRTIGWFIPESSNWAELLKQLVKAVADIDPEILITVPDEVKGSMEHRYQDFSTSHGTFWGTLFGPCTHVNMSTNKWTNYQKDGINYTLQYQAVLCFMQAVIINNSTTPSAAKMMKFFESCPQCIVPVETNFPELQEPVPLSSIPSEPSNPYLFLQKDDVDLMQEDIFISLKGRSKVSTENFPENSRDMYWYLVESLASKFSYSSRPLGSIQSDPLDMNSKNKSGFKKIRPADLFKVVLRNCWVNYHNENNKGRRTPSWERDKIYISRQLSLLPPRSFSCLGGFFFWDSSLKALKQERWFTPPISYPATPLGIAISCKSSLIAMTNSLTSLEVPISAIIDVTKERDSMVTKNQLCFDVTGGIRNKCTSCAMESFSTRITRKTTQESLLKIRCEWGHSVYDNTSEKRKKFTLLSLDQVADLLTPPIVTDMRAGKHEPIQFPPPFLLFSSASSPQYQDEPTIFENVSFNRELLEAKLISFVQIPTRSYGRVYEILSGLKITHRHNRLLVMGDGFGWSSVVTKMLNPLSEVWSWDLIDISQSPPHILHQSSPPTHYKFEMEIKNELSYSKISDIFHDGFERSIEDLDSTAGKFHLVISEIELCHNPGEGNYTYVDVIRRLMLIRSNSFLVKVVVQDSPRLMDIVNFVANHFNTWAVFNSLESPAYSGIFWLLLTGPRKREDIRYLSDECAESLIDSIKEQLLSPKIELMGILGPFSKSHELLALSSVGTSSYDTITSMTDEWLGQVGIVSWRSSNFTRMLNELRHFKLPYELSDLEGRDKKYYFKEDHERLRLRLICLAGSMLTTQYLQAEFLTTKWKLVWSTKGSKGMLDDDYYYNPVLIANGTEEDNDIIRVLSRHVKSIQLCRITTLRAVVFSKFGKKVTFQYIPHKELSGNENGTLLSASMLCFPVSKNSSYRLAFIAE